MTEISKSEIRDRTEEGRFERGIEYHHGGMVKNRVRRGHDLEAEVEGSRLQPYMVSIFLSEEEDVLTTACSCPDDYFGDCKHVVAVLLDWLDDPDSFREVEPVESSLEDRSREELIALVREMLDREPHLKSLLEAPLPGFSDESSELIDLYPYQQDVKRILDGYRGPGNEWDLASSLATIVSKGEDHIESKEFGYAEAVFRSVIEETLEFYEYTHDEGEILQEVQRAIDGLIRCLNAWSDRTEFRREIIDFLYWVVKWDIDFGGIDLMWDPWEAILKHAEQGDRQRFREKIIEGLEELRTEEHSHWRNGQYGRMLLDLDEIDGNTDRFLEEAEKFELHELRALKLLDFDRKDEAIRIAEKIENPLDVLEFADHLCERNGGREARRIVSEYADRNPHDRLKEWLAEFDEEKGDIESAIELEVDRFRSNPSPSQFQRVVELAEKLGCTDEYKSRLIGELKEDERFDILAKIFLDEKEWDRAWDYASRMEDDGSYLRSSRWIKEKIVKAGEESRPGRALKFYLNEVHRLVEKRGRKNYSRAASYLERVRDVYRREGKEKEWQQLITNLREEFDNLPACQDEFDKAGL